MNYYRIFYNREAFGAGCVEAVEEIAAETAADALVLFDVNVTKQLARGAAQPYFDGPRRMQAAGHELFTFRVDMREFHVHASDVGDAIAFFRAQRAGEGDIAGWEFTAGAITEHGLYTADIRVLLAKRVPRRRGEE